MNEDRDKLLQEWVGMDLLSIRRKFPQLLTEQIASVQPMPENAWNNLTMGTPISLIKPDGPVGLKGLRVGDKVKIDKNMRTAGQGAAAGKTGYLKGYYNLNEKHPLVWIVGLNEEVQACFAMTKEFMAEEKDLTIIEE